VTVLGVMCKMLLTSFMAFPSTNNCNTSRCLSVSSLLHSLSPPCQSYVSPDFSADRGWLHLEARYNNEALETGSLWAGYNFSVGKKLVLNATPMVGGGQL